MSNEKSSPGWSSLPYRSGSQPRNPNCSPPGNPYTPTRCAETPTHAKPSRSCSDSKSAAPSSKPPLTFCQLTCTTPLNRAAAPEQLDPCRDSAGQSGTSGDEPLPVLADELPAAIDRVDSYAHAALQDGNRDRLIGAVSDGDPHGDRDLQSPYATASGQYVELPLRGLPKQLFAAGQCSDLESGASQINPHERGGWDSFQSRICGALQAGEKLLIEFGRPRNGDLHALTVTLAHGGRSIEDDAALRHDFPYSLVDRREQGGGLAGGSARLSR